jgi:hypothetical protein
MLFAVGSTSYRTERLNARAAFMLLSRLTPLLPALDGIGRALSRRGHTSLVEAISIIGPLSDAPEEDLEIIIDACLIACEVNSAGEWTPAIDIVDALDLGSTLEIVAHIIAFNYQPMFSRKRVDRSWYGVGRRVNFKVEKMPDDLDWLLRPVLRGLCKYESLKDGTLFIEDIAEMNDALDVADENQHRAQQAAEKDMG